MQTDALTSSPSCPAIRLLAVCNAQVSEYLSSVADSHGAHLDDSRAARSQYTDDVSWERGRVPPAGRASRERWVEEVGREASRALRVNAACASACHNSQQGVHVFGMKVTVTQD